MANPEHLKILKQGVDVWNRWREVNEDANTVLKPDLSWADLSRLNLCGINLSNVNLENADLSKADLNGAIFINALCDDTDFTNVNLYRADLRLSSLKSAHLNDSDLCGADLSEANLQAAFIFDANLTSAKLWNAVISGANLTRANLSNTDLRYSDLRETTLKNATLTGAYLHGSARFGWNIEGVECEYIYFDINRKELVPKDRNFEPGEFERLYSEVPTIEIEFSEGITLMGMAVLEHVTRKIQTERPDLGLRFIAVDAKGLYPKTRFELHSIDQGHIVKDLIVQGFQEIRQDQQKYAQIIAQTILGELQGLGDDVRGQLRIIKQDVKALPREFKRHLDAVTQKILDNAGIHGSGIIQLVEQIRSNETAIQELAQLRDSDINEIEDIKERLSWLKPYFEDVFKKKFDTTGTKVIRAVFKAVSTHFAGDILGDQTDLKR